MYNPFILFDILKNDCAIQLCACARDPFGISQNSFFSSSSNPCTASIHPSHAYCLRITAASHFHSICLGVCVCFFFYPCFSHMHKYVLLCIGELQQIKTRRLKRRNNSSNARMLSFISKIKIWTGKRMAPSIYLFFSSFSYVVFLLTKYWKIIIPSSFFCTRSNLLAFFFLGKPTSLLLSLGAWWICRTCV